MSAKNPREIRNNRRVLINEAVARFMFLSSSFRDNGSTRRARITAVLNGIRNPLALIIKTVEKNKKITTKAV